MRTTNYYDLWTLWSLNAVTDMKKSAAFRNCTVTIITTALTGTITCYSSNQNWETAPVLSSTAADGNEFSAAQVTNLDSWSSIAWSTGMQFTSNTSVTRYEVNDNNNRFIGFKMTAYTSGSAILRIDMSDNS